jgi:threonine dehydratase
MQKLVSNIFTVSDEEIIECMKFVGEKMKMVVEPTGMLGLAGLRTCVQTQDLDLKGKRCGVVISGGNVDLKRYSKLISS